MQVLGSIVFPPVTRTTGVLALCAVRILDEMLRNSNEIYYLESVVSSLVVSYKVFHVWSILVLPPSLIINV